MHYLFDENGLFIGDSNKPLYSGVEGEPGYLESIELDLSEEDITKIKNGCTYIDSVITITYAYNEYLKQKDIQSFEDIDTFITKLKAKKAELDEIYLNEGCTTANKDMILTVTGKLQTEINTQETNRITLMNTGVVNHGEGIADNYADKIISTLRGN